MSLKAGLTVPLPLTVSAGWFVGWYRRYPVALPNGVGCSGHTHLAAAEHSLLEDASSLKNARTLNGITRKLTTFNANYAYDA